MVQVETFEDAKAVLKTWLAERGYFEIVLSLYQNEQSMNGGFFQINLTQPFGVFQILPDGRVIDAFKTLTK